MNERTKTGLEILEAALLLGILGDVLLRETPWGLNVFLWVSVLVAAMTAIVLRRKTNLWSLQTVSLHGALIFFAGMFVWRDAIELKLLNAFAILTILAVLTLPALKIKTHLAGVSHYIFAGIWSGINAAFAPLLLVFGDIKWKTLPQKGWTKHLAAVLRGLAIAAPILFVFGALFMAADAVFQGIIEETLRIDPDILLSHVFLIGLFSWITAGYLRGSLLGGIFASDDKVETVHNPNGECFCERCKESGKETEVKAQILSVTEPEQKEEEKKETEEETKRRDWRNLDNSILPKSLTLGAIEMTIVLGLMNLLFLSFVIVQIPYLFGGMELVQATPDFKLAEYARRGFGELVIVAALVLPILLFSHWLFRKDSPVNQKIYRVLAGIQIVLLFVIMISATQRLLLYTGNLGYGLTSARLYPMAFMVWLAIIFIWFALTIMRGAREQFAWGALWTALFMIGTLHVLNPDDFIVRTNVRLMQEGRDFDSYYVTHLGDDAVPALLESMEAMSFERQCIVKNKISQRLEKAQTENDFRTLNWSRWVAKKQMQQYSENLDTANCPEYTKGRYYSGF
jgi:hypothetical protein